MTALAGPDELIASARRWLDLLADGRLAEACEALVPNHYGNKWSPAELQAVLNDTFPPGSVFRREHPGGPVFSHTGGAAGDPCVSIVPFADGSGYSVDHAVPLNGAYSDLTAQLEFLKDGESLVMTLHDLHVL